jgi:hypothetical protein
MSEPDLIQEGIRQAMRREAVQNLRSVRRVVRATFHADGMFSKRADARSLTTCKSPPTIVGIEWNVVSARNALAPRRPRADIWKNRVAKNRVLV